MKMGVLEPFRFNERVNSHGRLTYDAITYLYFFGNEVFACGLSDTLRLRHAKEIFIYLQSCGVTSLTYHSKGERITWRFNGKRWGQD
jgi:TfoX/Sxy family transcriptional regulator of competence genes